jgi:hypothetical protein
MQIPQVLIGDTGYPNVRHLITPFKKNEWFRNLPIFQKRRIRRYNKRLSRGRVIVENTIGALKMRFPILKETTRIRYKNVGTIFYACAILHNIINVMGLPPPPDVIDAEALDNQPDYNL